MIRKLQRKFVLINMAMVGVVLLAVFALLIGFTVQRQLSSVNNALNMALLMRPDMDEPRRFEDFNLDKQPPFHFELDKESFFSSFCAELDENGELITVMRRNMSITDEDVETAVDAALSEGRENGTLTHLRLSYRLAQTSEGLHIAFVDRSLDWSTLRTLTLTCFAVFVLAMLALFAVSLYLSRWAIKPAQAAWDQQRQFVADASHELKTPLTVILANIGLLLSNSNETIASQRRWVESTRDEGLHMKKLVDDLLFLARADADRVQAPRVSINLSDAVWSAVLPFESIAFEKGIALDSDIDPDIDLIANAQQMHQAVSILLDNACKYTPSGGCIQVTLKKTAGKPILSVHNTGTSIDPKAIPHLFERFYRADYSRERDAGGYGLGLAILDTIVRAHNGKVCVESNAQTGTRFTIHFS